MSEEGEDERGKIPDRLAFVGGNFMLAGFLLAEGYLTAFGIPANGYGWLVLAFGVALNLVAVKVRHSLRFY
jgi:hypothetical protein